MNNLNNYSEQQIREELTLQASRRGFPEYCVTIDPNYRLEWFHSEIALKLEETVKRVENGEDVRLMIFMPPRHGKEIAHDTQILTKNGWSTHGELKVGDEIYGRNGEPVKVKWLSEEVESEYVVSFSDGSEFYAHGNHEWVVQDRKNNNKEIILETKEILNNGLILSEVGKRGGRYRYYVDANVSIKFETKELPIHPYMLGVWLGDGDSTGGRICCAKEDLNVFRKLKAIGYTPTSESEHKTTGVMYHYFSGLITQCRKLGLVQNKHIPDVYKFADKEQRLELLAGLVDTDGSRDNKSRYRFSTCSKQLAEDVRELVISLGSVAYIMEYEPITSTSGIVGRKKVYQVGFNTNHDIPVALERKKNERKDYIKRRRSIISIKEAENRKIGRCIEVEGGVYLIGKSLIPTHNSDTATQKFPSWTLGKHPEWPFIVSSYSQDLATAFGQGTRDLMDSGNYHAIFNTRLRDDTKAKANWMTDNGGGYTAVGVGGTITGKGFKIGIIDDPFKNREEADSEVVRESVHRWYRSTFYTRQEGHTAIILILTRWHDDDLAGRLLKEQAEAEKMGDTDIDRWEVLEFKALAEEDEKNRLKGEPLWPFKFDLPKLMKTKAAIGGYEWSALYQQNPIDTENQEFKKEWLQYRTQEEIDGMTTRKFATIDPAGSKKKKSDSTGVTRNYVNSLNEWNLKSKAYRINSRGIIDLIFELHAEGMEVIGIEEGVWKEAIEPFFLEKCEQENIWPNVVPLKHGGTMKETRIRGLIPRYENRKIFHIAHECSDLEEEYLRFPKAAHDDCLDSVAYQNQLASSPAVGDGDRLTREELEYNLITEVNDQREPIIIGVSTTLPMHYVVGNSLGLFYKNKITSQNPYREIEQIMSRYSKCFVVFDTSGDVAEAKLLQEKNPGHVFFAYPSNDSNSQEYVRWGSGDKYTDVQIGWNSAIQQMTEEIRKKSLGLYGSQEDWKDFIDEWLTLYRVWETDSLGNRVSAWESSSPQRFIKASVLFRVGLDKYSSVNATIVGNDVFEGLEVGRIFYE